MRRLLVKVLLAFILAGAFLATACSAPSSPAYPMENDRPPATILPAATGTPDSTEATVRCTQMINITYISIDPVPHQYLGDIITFNGTTTLAPGELITIRISQAWRKCPKCQMGSDSVDGCCGDFNRTVTVREGECGNNLWSLDIDTADHDFRADGEYWIGMYGRGSQVENSSFFTVSGIPRPNLTLNLPENDTGGHALRFSGRANTGNGPDEKLLLTVSSDSGRKVIFLVPLYVNGTGYFWNVTVNKSAIVPYNFLTVHVSSQTSPAVSIERVFLYNNEPVYYPYNPTGP